MITGEQVRQAVASAGIERIEHHECSMCGYKCAYIVREGNLYFDPGCYCSGGVGLSPRSWQDAANWIGIQRDDEHRQRIASLFGLSADSLKSDDETNAGQSG